MSIPAHTSRPQLSIVVPAYNEAGNVEQIAAAVAEALVAVRGWELVFVNDGSTDDTLARIKALAAQDGRVRFVSFTRNFGHQPAMRAGLRHARGSAAVLMDCDLQNPPAVVPALVAEWEKGAKIVLADRTRATGHGFFKRLASRWFYRMLSAIGDVRLEPGGNDFMLLDRIVVDAINGFENDDLFLRGLVRWLGYPIAKVPYEQGVRTGGVSKFTLHRMVDFAVTGIVAHSIKPLRIAVYFSLVFAAFGLLMTGYSLLSFFWISGTVTGWTSIMSAIALLAAGQFLVLGIVGEYVGRILRQARRWPVYIVAETEVADSEPAAEVVTPYARKAGTRGR